MRRLHVLALLAIFGASGTALHAQETGGSGAGAAAPRKVTKLPRLKTFVAAEYPLEKRTANVEGSVLLTIEISAVGLVNAVSVTGSAGEAFDAAAVDAARRFEFEPAEVDGKPAPAKITYRYDFTITPEPRRAEEIVPEKKSSVTDPLTPTPAAPPTTEEESTEILVRAPKARREAVATKISAEQARRVAGTQGDVLKVVQNLPGVSRPPLSSGQIVVWGSAPRETRVYVDGVEIPALYHGAALRSTINSDLVTSVELVPGAYGADYGRGLGGLVRIETRPLPREGTHGYVGADTLDGSGMITATLGERLRVGAAARYSYLDRALSAVSAPDVGDFFPIPRYRDYQAKATLELGRNEAIDAVFLGSNDELRRAVPSPDPARTRAETSSNSFHRAYLRYVRVTSRGETISVTPFAGYDQAETRTAFGEVPTRLEVGSWRYGLRASHRSKLHRQVELSLGVDALGSSSEVTRVGTLTLPPREGDVTVFGQAPGSDFNADTWSANIVDIGPYAFADVQLGKLTVTPGVRFDAFLIEGSRLTPRVGLTPAIGFSRLEPTIDPRLTVRYQASARLAVTGSVGTYHQAPDPEDLSAVFGTPALSLSRATHVSVGEALKLTPTLGLEMVAFYKYLGNLAFRTRQPEPRLARALVQDGEGRSYGAQILLRQEIRSGFFGWISYSISRSERRYVLEERFRLFDFDQPHVLAVVLSKEVGRWTFGARFRYTSGAPRTPVIGSFYDVHGDQAQPTFGAQNTARISNFYQLDLRAERTFPLGALTLAVFADVLNATFHENHEEIVYSASYRRKGFITGLPTLAVVGARLEF